MGDNLVFAVRGNTGFCLKRGLAKEAPPTFEQSENPKQTPCEVFSFSNAGHLFAYCDSQKTRVIEVVNNREVMSVDLRRSKYIFFSPKDTIMVTYEPYAIYGQRNAADQKPDPNLRFYSVAEGRLITTVIAQKEATWKPQWSDDETVFARLVGSELLFCKGTSFDKYDKKLVLPHIGGFALSPGSGPHHVACFISGFGSTPASVQVRKLNDEFSIVANKTFFKCDNASLHWNHKGTALLVMSSVDVDSSNQSYYGEQTVYLINIQSNESFKVPLGKNGPVYQAKWNPNGKEFAVCYGFMPAKVTFYNVRGDPIFDTLEGPRNDLHYNEFGNILLICGFGNLAKGKMEFWDVEKKKEIISIDVPNTTQFQWAPDGQHFMTATTTPRLRIDNVYRLWHYSGRLISETPFDPPSELWEVKFRPMSGYNKFEVKELTKHDKMQAGLLMKKKDESHPLNNIPVGAIRQSGAYVPPHLRNKKPGGGGAVAVEGKTAMAIKPQVPDNEKKAAVLRKKIEEISKLKERIARGDVLQPNQLSKIENEMKFAEELAALKV